MAKSMNNKKKNLVCSASLNKKKTDELVRCLFVCFRSIDEVSKTRRLYFVVELVSLNVIGRCLFDLCSSAI